MKKIAIGLPLFMCLVYAAWQGLNLYDDRFPYGRMWETPAVRPHEAVLPVMESGSIPVFKGETRYKTMDPGLLVSPLAGKESEFASDGMELYDIYCAQCHGTYLNGNGTVGLSFSPLPTNLRSAQVQALSDGLLFKRISYGNPPEGRQPPLATTIDVSDRWKIIAYIRMAGVRKDIRP